MAQFDKLKYLGRFQMVIVFLFFVAPVAFTLVHLGFKPDTMSGHSERNTFLSAEMLMLVNAACGLFGGLIMAQKQRVIVMISSAVTTLVTTAAALLYFSWRESIISIEIILPLGIGIIAGVFMFKLLSKFFPAKEKKSYTTPQ